MAKASGNNLRGDCTFQLYAASAVHLANPPAPRGAVISFEPSLVPDDRGMGV